MIKRIKELRDLKLKKGNNYQIQVIALIITIIYTNDKIMNPLRGLGILKNIFFTIIEPLRGYNISKLIFPVLLWAIMLTIHTLENTHLQSDYKLHRRCLIIVEKRIS